MKGVLSFVLLVLFSTNVLAWEIPAGERFNDEKSFTEYLALNLDCEWGDPIPVDLGMGIPWAGHDYYQLEDGSWMAKGAMLCHHPRGQESHKLVISHWSVGFKLKKNGEIVTNGQNTRRYQGYDYRNIQR